MAAAPTSRPPDDVCSHVVYLEGNGKTHYLTHGRRLSVGSAAHCDIVLDGPGVAPHHARLWLRIDGRIEVKPLHGQVLRIGLARTHKPTAVEPGQPIGVGLTTFRTGTAASSFALQMRLALADVRPALRDGVRRAPWFLVSVVFHAALLMLLLLLWTRPGGLGKGEGSVIEIDEAGIVTADGMDDVLVEQEEDVAEPDVPEPEMPDTEPTSALEPVVDPGEPVTGVGPEGNDALRDAMLDDIGRGTGRRTAKGVPKGVSKKFERTITKLRKTGLEVAFLFDSTASMSGLLEQAKDDLLDIFLLFEELVPSTRMALLTYRDHGDEYVTRETRMGVKHYEALAFLASVRADGGGDFEEAVDVALDKARKLRWRSRTRKIIVLIGDAPPRRERIRRTLDATRRIARKNGQVHCLVAGDESETWRAMHRIAKAGGGRCLPRQERDQLALQLLSLALGPDSHDDLRKLLAQRSRRSARRRAGPRASTRPSPAILARALGATHPDPVIVDAWTWAEPHELGRLGPVLDKARLSREGLQALYYIVNRSLERHGRLHEPIPPATARPVSKGLPRDLRQRLRRLAQREAAGR